MSASQEVIVTCFSNVKLSPRVVDFLNKNAPDRHKGKKFMDKKQRKIVDDVTNAVYMCSWIEWANGGVLEEF